jgi:hypothetical protein
MKALRRTAACSSSSAEIGVVEGLETFPVTTRCPGTAGGLLRLSGSGGTQVLRLLRSRRAIELWLGEQNFLGRPAWGCCANSTPQSRY